MSNFYIYIEQTDGFMSTGMTYLAYKLDDIRRIYIPDKFFTQIGKTGDCVHCRNMVIEPGGLTIPIYISRNNIDFEDVLDKLNNITKGDVNQINVHLSLSELNHANYQHIKIKKSQKLQSV